MATSSNTYTTLSNQETYGEILRCGAGFTFVDFLPGVIEPSGLFKSATYENFRALVNRANEFLRSNRRWKIVSCESVEFKSRNNRVNPIKMTYLEYGEGHTSFIRGLRLWLTERKDEKEEEQQIGYINLIPEVVEEGGIFKSPKYETLDSLIQRFNSKLIPGRIITIESQEVKCPYFKDFDPDRSKWTESGERAKSFLFVIRIFYEITAGTSEEIGMTDFIPSTISEGGIFSLPKYEPFSNVINKASTWLSNQGNIRFCNAQTLEIKVRRGCEINTQRMDYTESGSTTTYYVRILRIAYTKPFENPYSYSISEKPSIIRQLTCRTFTPLQLTGGIFVPEYENLAITKERISAWVRATGARVVSAETTAYRIRSGGERKYGIETTFTYNRAEKNEYWMFVIRLYLDGVYREPPPEMLPAMPAIDESSCNIS